MYVTFTHGTQILGIELDLVTVYTANFENYLRSSYLKGINNKLFLTTAMARSEPRNLYKMKNLIF